MTTEEKIDVILRDVTDMKTELARSLVHQDNHRECISDHDKKIDDLIALKNKGIGISLAVGSGLGAFFSWIFKHV